MASTSPVVIFQGSPSQAINTPFFVIRAFYALALIYAFNALRARWPHPLTSYMSEISWLVLSITSAVVLLSVFKRYLKVASTIYTIDEARITTRYGVMSKVIASLEMFRVMDVTFVQSWWQGALGIGTLVIQTSDNFHPVMTLYGMENAEQLRASLNIAAVELRRQGGYREVTVGPT